MIIEENEDNNYTYNQNKYNTYSTVESLNQEKVEQKKDYYKFDITTFLKNFNYEQINNQKQTFDYLTFHQIPYRYRAKLFDWIFEVISKENYSIVIYYKCINWIDKYLKYSKNLIEVKDLQLIGITCLYMAVKYENNEIIDISNLLNKIQNNKINKNIILIKESEILITIGFRMTDTNIYEFSNLLIAFTDLENKIFNDNIVIFKRTLSSFIQMCEYDYLIKQNYSIIEIALSSFIIIWKILEKNNIINESTSITNFVLNFFNINSNTFYKKITIIHSMILNFENKFNNCLNIKKFN